MPLAAPVLDDRKFQDLVDEARKRIPYYCKEWTDHNLSDPGITLIELFAWMTEVQLYRLNQVPDLHYIRFMELLGITLQEPVPAQAPVTFWLSAPQPNPLLIPAGTEVASTQTETELSIVFTTQAGLTVQPPRWVSAHSLITLSGKKGLLEHNLRSLQSGFAGLDVFSLAPQVNDALYFGFENDLSRHILGFELDFDSAGGAGIDPSLPPYVWEASTGDTQQPWQACELDVDTTRGMNSPGRIRLHLPAMGTYRVDNQELYWVRARVKEISLQEKAAGMRPYEKSPRLRQANLASWGGTVSAQHAREVRGELLGRSDGARSQHFFTQFKPLLRRQPGESLLVQLPGEPPQIWEEVPDFATSNAEDHHYILDSLTGELRLGPAVRQPDGTLKLYGAVPPRGASLAMAAYRWGGGEIGNLQAGRLNTLKSAIPYIDHVSNREPAQGGLDAESLEAARVRTPALLRSHDRAVTTSDFEFLAMQSVPGVFGRVKCLQPDLVGNEVNPSQVFLVVIPQQPDPGGYLTPGQLEPDPEALRQLSTYLDERRLLTTRLDIRPPAYAWVSVTVRLRAEPGVDPATISTDVLSRLYRFLNPLTGGLQGDGWPFGRGLYISDVFPCLQGIPHVQFVRGLQLFAAFSSGEAQGEPLEFVEVLAHGVIASGIHKVEFV